MAKASSARVTSAMVDGNKKIINCPPGQITRTTSCNVFNLFAIVVHATGKIVMFAGNGFQAAQAE